MEASARQGDAEELLLTSLPDTLLANLVWPPCIIDWGVCVCNRALTHALLGAPKLELRIEPYTDEEMVTVVNLVKSMTSLRELDFSPIKIRRAGAEALAGALPLATGLQSLLLGECRLFREGVTTIAPHLPAGLLTLDLDGNLMEAEGATALAPSLERLTSLQHLELGRNEIMLEGMCAICPALQCMTSLQKLGIAGCDLGAGGAVALAAAVKDMTGIRELNLAGNGIGGHGISALGLFLRNSPSLETLELGNNQLGAEGVRSLGSFLRAATSLRHLDISNSGLESHEVEALRFLREHETLETLDLCMNQLGEEGGSVLGPFLPKGLRRLKMISMRLGAEGVMILWGHLEGLTRLEELDLRASSLGPAGGFALGAFLDARDPARMTTLRKLPLSWNDLGIGGLPLGVSLARFTGLQELDLTGNGMDEADDQELSVLLSHIKKLELESI